MLIVNISSFKTLFQPLAISFQHLIALKNQSYIIRIFNFRKGRSICMKNQDVIFILPLFHVVLVITGQFGT